MTIEEYKEKLISVVKEMEKEHGARINKVVIGKDSVRNFPMWPAYEQFADFKVEIEL
jgi:hypothetical protein